MNYLRKQIKHLHEYKYFQPKSLSYDHRSHKRVPVIIYEVKIKRTRPAEFSRPCSYHCSVQEDLHTEFLNIFP
jgi:hypothetical protein